MVEAILVVEDGEAVRRLVCEMLQRQGWRVLDAPNGTAALEVLAEHPEIDLVVTDVVMPGINGIELARRISKMRPDLRILFMSGYSDEPLIEDFNQVQGSSLFLQKPFTSAVLVRKVREILQRSWSTLQSALQET